jgi:hypothetical protein
MIFSARRRAEMGAVVRMKKALLVAAAAGVAGALLLSADWPSSSGNPQRDGWLRNEDALTREAAANGGIKLLYSFKADPKPQNMGPPVMLTNIIGWKGFKALLFVGGASDVYSIDYQLGKPYFRTHLDYRADQPQAAATAACPGGITAGVVIAGGSSTSVARVNTTPRPAAGGGGGGGRARGSGAGPHVWAVGQDGRLQTLREQDGDNQATPAVQFLPANSRSTALNLNGTEIYAATQNECGGNPNALYAIDIGSPEKKVVSFPTHGHGFAGSAGVAVSTDGGTIFGLIPDGEGPAAGKYSNTVVALGAKDLAVKDYFTPGSTAPALKKDAVSPGATPAVFEWGGKDVIVAGASDGRIYLLDSASLGGPDHHTPLAQSEVFAAANGRQGIWNAFATWIDPAGNARWIYASITGAPAMKFPMANGAAADGSIVAFRVEDSGGKPKLVPAWSSRNVLAPAAPAVANGLVFALSKGRASRGDEKTAKNAVLYGFDSSTGREIWSSGQTATSYATGGLAVNASSVIFATHDSQIHAYGIPIVF